MDEAAPQAAGTGGDEDALAALRYGWGEAYRIGYDDEHGWWASRRDRIGALITEDDPGALGKAIFRDYEFRPVPRDGSAPPAES